MTQYYQYTNGQITDRHGTVLTLYEAELRRGAFREIPPAYRSDMLNDLTGQLAKAIEAFKRDMVTS